jgi:hypothetical protein
VNNKLTARERGHLATVKNLPCSVCDAAGPSDAHHVKQGLQYTCIALCPDCHTGSHNGLHGRRAMWNVMRMAEMDALNVTLRRLFNGA